MKRCLFHLDHDSFFNCRMLDTVFNIKPTEYWKILSYRPYEISLNDRSNIVLTKTCYASFARLKEFHFFAREERGKGTRLNRLW